MEILNTKVNQMVIAAREYCQLVDGIDGMPRKEWLSHVASLLPRLREAIGQLDAPEPVAAQKSTTDYEARFELFLNLYEWLGERDGYTIEHDVMHEGQRLSGGLADDLTDIYFDLKHGLELLRLNPVDPHVAINEWKHSFILHWQHHLQDAERQINAICGRRQG